VIAFDASLKTEDQMKTWTLLTAPGWLGKCPSMPGQHGPTYANQIEVVSKWMAPATRSLYEALRWKECPRLIFDLYQRATEFERLVGGDMQERKPKQ
jgi:hypothetical protein